MSLDVTAALVAPVLFRVELHLDAALAGRIRWRSAISTRSSGVGATLRATTLLIAASQGGCARSGSRVAQQLGVEAHDLDEVGDAQALVGTVDADEVGRAQAHRHEAVEVGSERGVMLAVGAA